MDKEKEKAILQEYKSTGNPKVLEPIFAYLEKIFRYKLSKNTIINELEIDDLVQELQLQAFNAIETFDMSRNIKFTSYVASNLAVKRKVVHMQERNRRYNSRYGHQLQNDSPKEGYDFYKCVERVSSDELDPYKSVQFIEMFENIEHQTKPEALKVLLKTFLGVDNNSVRPTRGVFEYMTTQFKDRFYRYL